MLASLKTAMPVIKFGLLLAFFTLICTQYSVLYEVDMVVGGLLFISKILAVFDTPFVYGLISVALLKANMCIFLSTQSNCACRYAYVCVCVFDAVLIHHSN